MWYCAVFGAAKGVQCRWAESCGRTAGDGAASLLSENQDERADSVRFQMYSGTVRMHRENHFLDITTT
jgi:hypothetical protein